MACTTELSKQEQTPSTEGGSTYGKYQGFTHFTLQDFVFFTVCSWLRQIKYSIELLNRFQLLGRKVEAPAGMNRNDR
jgi:hypothetical protein